MFFRSNVDKVSFALNKAMGNFMPQREIDLRFPKKDLHPDLLDNICTNRQPFCPAGTDVRTSETILKHTLKDFWVAHSILSDESYRIVPGSITFPVGVADPESRILMATRRVRGEFGLDNLSQDRDFMNIFGQFVLYHDNAKRTPRLALDELTSYRSKIVIALVASHIIDPEFRISPVFTGKEKSIAVEGLEGEENDFALRALKKGLELSRLDHERAGAVAFESERYWFESFLGKKGTDMAELMMRHHGLYAKIVTSQTESAYACDYKEFIKDLTCGYYSPGEIENMVTALFFFNIVEGLQSDMYSRLFLADGLEGIAQAARIYQDTLSIVRS